jgi:hypothetical protein
MTQSAVARFDAGGTAPTLPVLGRIARALDADLTVRVEPRPHVVDGRRLPHRLASGHGTVDPGQAAMGAGLLEGLGAHPGVRWTMAPRSDQCRRHPNLADPARVDVCKP